MSPRKLAIACILTLLATTSRAEIPLHPQARTRAQLQQHDARFLHRILTDAYIARAHRNVAQDEAMLRLLAEAERCMLLDDHDPKRDELRRQAKLMVEAQISDALVSFAYGYSYGPASSAPGETHLKRAIEKLPEQSYSHYLAAQSAQILEGIYRRDRQHDRRREMNQTGRRLLMQWVTDQPDEWRGDALERFLKLVRWYTSPAADLAEDWHMVDEFLTQLKAHGVDEWIIEFATGHACLQKAWSARGSAWAANVRDDQWKRHTEQMATASFHLQRAHEMVPGLAEPATKMIEVCYGGIGAPDPPANPRYWFDQAVSREFDCLGAYGALAVALLPRWGGSHEALLAFARECADTGRYDTLVPYRVVHMVRMIGNDEKNEGGYERLKQLHVFPLVREVLEGYIGHEVDRDRRRSYVSELLFWCHLLDQPEVARQMWPLLDGEFDREIFSYYRGYSVMGNQFTDRDLLLLVARGGAARKAIDMALSAEQDKAYERAIGHYQEAMKLAEDDAYATRLLRQRLTKLTWRESFESHQWTPLTFDEELSGWIPLMGVWKRVDDRTVEGVTDPRGLRLLLDMDIGRQMEIRGVIRYIHQVKPKYFNAGILFANEYWTPHMHRGFLFVRDSGELKKIGPSSNVPALVAKVQLGNESRFSIRINNEMAWVEMDGQPIHTGVLLEDRTEFLRQSQLCLGGE